MIRIECQAQLVVKGPDGREASLSDVVPLLALVDRIRQHRAGGDA